MVDPREMNGSAKAASILMLELSRNDEHQAFPAGLIDDGQDAELAPIMGATLAEVVSPYMPRILRPQVDA
jgi:hypothetical protein